MFHQGLLSICFIEEDFLNADSFSFYGGTLYNKLKYERTALKKTKNDSLDKKKKQLPSTELRYFIRT